jgi:cytochrome c
MAAPSRRPGGKTILIAGIAAFAVAAAVALAAGFAIDEGGGSSPPAPAPNDPRVLAGAQVAEDCVVCHALYRTDPPRVGPPLWEIVGSEMARMEGYAYSEALAQAEGDWTLESLNAFLLDPHGYLPGTRMTFEGIEDDEARANLIVFLSSLQD